MCISCHILNLFDADRSCDIKMRSYRSLAGIPVINELYEKK